MSRTIAQVVRGAGDRRVLVTGGAGFIGSHLVDALVERGDAVLVLDDLSTGAAANLDHHLRARTIEFHSGSILDAGLVRGLAARSDLVFHLAAAVGVKLILERPLDSLATNVRGTEVVVEACHAAGAKLLLTSSSEIYGKSSSWPVTEESDRVLGSTLNVRWSYSSAKALDEMLAFSYWRERGLPAVIARLFNCTGPRQTGAYGMVLPTLVRQALAGEPLTVYGDGHQSRCFCHVEDTVAALLALAEHPDAVGQVFNVGSMEEVTINRLAELVLEVTGSGSPIVHVPYEQAYAPGFEEMPRRVPDTGKIERLTGWRPRHTLRQTIEDLMAAQRRAAGEMEPTR